MRIALYEDNAHDRAFLAQGLKEYYAATAVRTSPELCAFERTESLLTELRSCTYDAVFLQANTGEGKGIEPARRLRADGYAGAIVLTAETEAYAVEGYEVNALQYLLKPYSYQQLFGVLKRLPAPVKAAESPPYITVMASRIKRQILLSDILWIEAGDHCAVLHTRRGAVRTARLLSDLYEEVEDIGYFIKCNRGAVVNANYVLRCDQEFVYLENNDRVLMNLRNSRKIRQQLQDYLWNIML